MSRTARLTGESGYYHIIIRGIGKQILFEDEWDYKYFISLMQKYSDETGIKICAYCLMDNHVHMLIHDENNAMSLFMKKIGVSYAGFYNHKYERTGHLFQDRFKNEIIYDERYFLTVLRYILRNPEKAGLSRTENYRWSSYKLGFSDTSFIDTKLIRELFRTERDFREYVLTDVSEKCMEFEEEKKDDIWALEIIRQRLGLENGIILQTYDRARRDDAIRKLKTVGMSIRQIERLTGLGKGIIQRA
ncbi:MAG: transposase [Lachnospiraceae bacterium]|nr:transposase [Lachnospiraceae bacterium]